MAKIIDARSIPVLYPRYAGMDSFEFDLSYDDGMPAPFTKVSLYDQNKNYTFFQKRTDKDGFISFNGLDLKNHTFFVIAHDPVEDLEKKFNGVIADNIGGPNYVHEEG